MVSERLIFGNYNLPDQIEQVGTGTQTYSEGKVEMSVTSGQFSVARTYVSAHRLLLWESADG